jgi:hypothetical protein
MHNRIPLRILAAAIEQERNPCAPKIKLVFDVRHLLQLLIICRPKGS